MYDFHYNFIKTILILNCYLWHRQSHLTYEIKSDVFEDFYKDKYLFDLSNYAKDSKIFDPVNEKIIIKMKDVHKGKPICKFVAIKTKMHCILPHNGKEFNTAKGVNIAMEFYDILWHFLMTFYLTKN